MARIRTIKPKFFKHEALFDLEAETGLPVRLAFAGLWCQCDKAGRFEWQPRTLKTDILPFDDVDFSRVLDALATRGFVVRYECEGRFYGVVPGFGRHQVVNNKERESELPEPPEGFEDKAELTRAQRVDDACPTPLGKAQGEYGRGIGNREKEDSGSNEPEGQAPDDPGQSSDDKAYWAMSDKAAAAGIKRSVMGKLLKVHGGCPVSALYDLESALDARNPKTCIHAMIRNIDGTRSPPSDGLPTDMPAEVRKFVYQGYEWSRRKDGCWFVAGGDYDQNGKYLG